MDKKEAIKNYKQTIQPMGIYQIKNNRNGKLFIGSAKNLSGKLNSHRFQLKNGLHPIKDMQKEFNEVGEEGFSFEILDYLKPKDDLKRDYTEELKLLEDMWMEKLQPFNEKGYNKPTIR
ncbi:GIY-YIG nuclease family protein [candidate division KSB1 bacterium]|nr:GIY-YIG nuclease family protein [candidate division KSB1 bacterium]